MEDVDGAVIRQMPMHLLECCQKELVEFRVTHVVIHLKGFIDGMLDGTIPESEYKHYLGVVSQETGRLARLVQNMLDITKLESGEVKGTPKNYDIWSTVTDVVLSDERRIEDGKIDIQGLGPTGTMVYADPDFIHQVVYNIVDNAIKFTPPDGVIKFFPMWHASLWATTLSCWR